MFENKLHLTSMTQSWSDLMILGKIIQTEIYFLLVILGLIAYAFYRFVLHSVSTDRHRSLRKKFKGLLKSFIILSVFFAIFQLSLPFKNTLIFFRALPYLGLLTLVAGCFAFIQVCRLLILMYFFLTSMQTAVPILLVNIFTLILSLFLAGWIFTSLFNFHIAPLLATSAAFSIILGLALQDTLGNLFAGISLQLDNVFQIGNWVEINVGGQKIVGQISEISWRSVILIGFADDIITIPNRIVAQSQISNWTRADAPIIRSQSFRLPYNVDIDNVKQLLNDCVLQISAIKKEPAPLVIVTEMQDSWLILKLVYYIDNYGSQYIIGDEVINSCLKKLAQHDIKIASPILEVHNSKFN